MVDLSRSPTAAPAAALLALVACGAVTPARSAEKPGAGESERSGRPPLRLIVQDEHIHDSGGRAYDDPSVYVGYRQVYGQAWYGEFTKGLELGGFVRDRRRSAYVFFSRHRKDSDTIFDASTGQVLGGGFVLFAGLRYIHVLDDTVADGNLWLPSVGFDKYYGDYHFFAFRAIPDPRVGGRYSFVLSNRLGARDRYLTLGLVPRTDGETGYFLQGKWRWIRAGFGRFNQFDFTQVNRTIYNVGAEFEF